MTFNNFAFSTAIRKSLKNIINLTINIVHSLLTFKDVNKNNRVKKFNTNRFKKDLNNSRSKSINFIDDFVCLKKIHHAKMI